MCLSGVAVLIKQAVHSNNLIEYQIWKEPWITFSLATLPSAWLQQPKFVKEGIK